MSILKPPPAYFEFSETGAISTENGGLVTSEEIHYHLAAYVLAHWLKEKRTDEEILKDPYDFDTAKKFCKWLVFAVLAAPNLLPDFTGTPIPDSHPPAMRFTPKKRWRADRMHGWK